VFLGDIWIAQAHISENRSAHTLLP